MFLFVSSGQKVDSPLKGAIFGLVCGWCDKLLQVQIGNKQPKPSGHSRSFVVVIVIFGKAFVTKYNFLDFSIICRNSRFTVWLDY